MGRIGKSSEQQYKEETAAQRLLSEMIKRHPDKAVPMCRPDAQ